ncbi:MAG TPA: hypothetical protein VFC63_05755 [Blastocatellia bacterium]|nr:hypothetical protein [Blastocatellia bacterium]
MASKRIEYLSKRLIVIFIASVVVFFYYLIFALVMNFDNGLTPSVGLLWLFIPESVIFVAIVILTPVGCVNEGVNLPRIFLNIGSNERRSLFILILVTVLFLVLLSLPLFLLGGAEQSCFGSLLVAMAGIIVIVTKSAGIRFTIAFGSILLFGISIFDHGHMDVVILRPNMHKWFQISSIVLSLVITLVMSWKGEFTIFDDPVDISTYNSEDPQKKPTNSATIGQ